MEQFGVVVVKGSSIGEDMYIVLLALALSCPRCPADRSAGVGHSSSDNKEVPLTITQVDVETEIVGFLAERR